MSWQKVYVTNCSIYITSNIKPKLFIVYPCKEAFHTKVVLSMQLYADEYTKNQHTQLERA